MTLRQYILLTSVLLLLAGGQLLFRKTALSTPSLTSVSALMRLASCWSFIAALVIYALATLLWVQVLREVPLSRAYPFMALSFVLVPLSAALLLGDSLNLRSGVGISFVVVGLLVIGSGS